MKFPDNLDELTEQVHITELQRIADLIDKFDELFFERTSL